MVNIRDFKDRLSDLAYRVCVESETEPPFSGKYVHPVHDGVFLCVGCHTALFYAQDQYDSKSGWPSFTAPFEPDVVDYYEQIVIPDMGSTLTNESAGVKRIEVRCACCQSHLGHVFDDGPEPDRLRYCINSVALILEDELS